MKSAELKNKLEELRSLISKAGEEVILSAIEHDLALQKTREIYDLLLKITDQKPYPQQSRIPEINEQEVSAADVEEEIQELETDTSEIDNDEILSSEKQSEIAVEAPKKASVQKNEPDLFSTEKALDKEAPKSRPQTKPGAIGDIFSETNEKETIAEKMQKDKIDSLKVAIGINDKFYFINELFNGSLNDYTAVVEDLDNSPSIDEAINQLEELASKHQWNKESEAYIQFLSFVERKFH